MNYSSGRKDSGYWTHSPIDQFASPTTLYGDPFYGYGYGGGYGGGTYVDQYTEGHLNIIAVDPAAIIRAAASHQKQGLIGRLKTFFRRGLPRHFFACLAPRFSFSQR